MVVFEGDHKLGQADHAYYDGLVAELKGDTIHIQYVMNLWGEGTTAAGVQSADGKAAYASSGSPATKARRSRMNPFDRSATGTRATDPAGAQGVRLRIGAAVGGHGRGATRV